MGTKPRQRPQRLGEKLLAIRNAFGLSQTQMVKRLDVEGNAPSQISEFETGKREPSLIVVLQYARLAGVCADVLIDDKLDLSAKLPAKPKCSSLKVVDFRFHDLRHTAASWLRMSGADIHTVAQLLGHKDLRMAARYQHLSPAYLANAVSKLDTVFGDLSENADGQLVSAPQALLVSANSVQ